MNQQRISPRITHLSWRRLDVDAERSFKDAKLYPGGAREWDWRETGTDHDPAFNRRISKSYSTTVPPLSSFQREYMSDSRCALRLSRC